MKWSAAAGAALLALPANSAVTAPLPLKLETRSSLNSRLSNIHVERSASVEGAVSYTYGSCQARREEEAHHSISQPTDAHHDRLVWVIPENVQSDGCISAWSRANGRLVGRSRPQSFDFKSIKMRRDLKARATKPSDSVAIHMTTDNGINPWGPWFDGVKLLEDKEISALDVEKAKSKNIAIVGAGMSGLMTYLCLTQAGMTNVSIIEGGNRLGGRVHTEYLSGGPFDYSYQEMGPMRFPNTITLGNETYNVSDHQLVFQLAEEMNSLNGHSKNLSVDFIPWYQSNSNGLYYHDGIKNPETGLPPTLAELAANSSLALTRVSNNSTKSLSEKVDAFLPDTDKFFAEMAQNMFKAHADWLSGGLAGLPGDQWSEFGFMVNYLRGSLNDTAFLSASAHSYWDTLYEGMYFSASTWKTIDGGLNRLPLSFHPLVDNATTLNRRVERVAFDAETQKVTLHSRNSYKDSFESSEHDYAVIAAPFSIVKKWRFSPALDLTAPTLANAIQNLEYRSACKVALEFRTRFWEHLPQPIYGSCSTSSDIPGIGSICYPSYNINGTDGPASILASYISGAEWGDRWVSTPEEEHVQYVLNAMAEIHGEELVKEQYTGKFNRRCWALDPLESASWASPAVGQHELYLPEYFQTRNNLVFVGEHTSYTHAWIASALESGIRGSVQLLLELGLVDEAKATVDKWMARWIDV
ncbi:hypothetical protein NEUTE1DRAFT_76687 [Neurospora tetrasperma FGSC 2508]|uniref:Amine oxidase domain-containing protein n=1 Tax=Neurospora tetrasperma (strain FGSC 2508 / ATCC MYA-4615 / P0657) TaxID=510951 RepID=F8MAZ1_NEUT8|nr:uncharacterized protein NEUTE1DRAFT_76687 [Neurospora tetrasperma FGSC 2508]EGO61010.1 hypothetical protein NEUTE1DRAFT_76687 [Neurospora tetrasperma FGSC 2508]EGZ74983.1 hypothetical protein NEUTE2DRAFT_104235 [Neurospora tetrasperma FGSC 2509]